jgi:hypothetical protein
MTGDDFDLLFVADARFPGGTSTSLANEIEAAHRAGFTMGLLHVNGPVLRRPRVFHPALRAAIDQRKIRLVDPAANLHCRLAIVHHPMLFPKPLQRPVSVSAEHALLVAHHPAFDGFGHAQYDIGQQLASLEASLGLRARVAPVGPQVRAGLAATGAPLTRADWHNLIDPAAWRRPFRRFGDPIVIGRHARPDPLKWPDRRGDILGAYPDNPRFRVEVLGGGPFLPELVGGIPANWHVQEFGAEAPRDFLARLDAYVYFHSDRWIEAFGYSVLEALASGLPTILPPSFRKLFGPAALYGRPDQTRQLLETLASSEKKQREQRQRAIETVKQRFSLDQFAHRLDTVYGLRPRKSSSTRRMQSPARRTALFVSSNGVGLGHLTRQMAIARALPPWIEPVFFTLSRAARLVSEAGYLVEHVPFHRYLATTPECWNPIFERELGAALRFYRPAALLFDGNVPYAGLLGAMRSRPEMLSFWIRRGMWRDHHGGILGRADRFDAVIEPRDLAEADDSGPTSAHRGKVVSVDPVLLVAPQRRMPRPEARAALGIEEGRLAVSLQLGAGNNFDFSRVRRRVLERLLAHPEIDVIELVSPIAETTLPRSSSPRHRIRRMYPAYRYSRAFDAAVSAAGYNSFHENVLGGLPTLFVANRAEEMDRQDLRGEFAERMGLAWTWSEDCATSLDDKLAQLLDPTQRKAVQRRASALAPTDGAGQAARFVVEMLLAAR